MTWQSDLYILRLNTMTRSKKLSKYKKSFMVTFLQKIRDEGIILEEKEGKLKIHLLKDSIDGQLLEEIKNRKDELIRFLARNRGGYDPISPAPAQPAYPLPSAQKRLWILSQMNDSAVAYNTTFSLTLEEGYDISIIGKAFQSVIERHEILRTVFRLDEHGEIRQWILSPGDIDCAIRVVHFDEDPGAVEEMSRIIESDVKEPFDLMNGPLLRCILFQTDHDRYVMHFNLHHIVFDAWSIDILQRDLFAFYHAFAAHRKADLPIQRLQYKDFSVWQIEQEKSERYAKSEQFWLTQLAGELGSITLPTHKIRPKIRTFNGRRLATCLPAGASARLREFCNANRGTLFQGFLAAAKVLLYRYTGQKDIIVGIPVAGRRHSDLEDMIGMFVNTVVLRDTVDPEESFTTYFKRIKENALKAFEHQDYSFDQLVEKAAIKWDMSRNPVFDIMVMPLVAGGYILPNHWEVVDLGRAPAKFDLNLGFDEAGGDFRIELIYNTDVYERNVMERFLLHCGNIIDTLAGDPDRKIGQVEYLSPHDKDLILFGWNSTDHNYSHTKTLVDVLEQRVAQTPDRMAFCDDKREITYLELNRIANKIGWDLKDSGIGRGDYVCLHLSRSVHYVQAMFGVLKAGAAYFPLETATPSQRKVLLLNDLDVKVIITEGAHQSAVLSLAADVPGLKKVIRVDELGNELPVHDLNCSISAEDEAYVIYTSGSTGKPKGVVVQHRPVINVIECLNRTYNVNSLDKLLLVVSFGFDLSVYDVFGMTEAGGCVRIATEAEAASPSTLASIIYNEGITFWDSAPAMLTVLVNELINGQGSLVNTVGTIGTSRLRLAWLSGDWIPLSLPGNLRKFFDNVEFVAMGGATEAVIWSNHFLVNDISEHWVSIPYGRPIWNARYYILDEFLNPCAIGVEGDLYIGGEVLAKEYKNDPGLTAEKFPSNPYDPGKKFYKTGDRARYFEDGNIEFLGRKDHQVKIRGFRIELGEVEANISQYSESLKQVVVVSRETGGERMLVAYYVSGTAIDKADLRSFLQKRLPEYMIPGFFVALESMPLTANRKVDRNALPAIAATDVIRKEYVDPRTNTERILAGIWEGLLGIENAGITDDFFQLGGHSLSATRLVSYIDKEFAVKINLRELFIHTTIKDQAGLIDARKGSVYDNIPAAGPATSYPLSSSQKRTWAVSQLQQVNIAYNERFAFRLEGDLDVDNLRSAFKDLLCRHEILRTSFIETADGSVEQVINAARDIEFPLQLVDIRQAGDKDRVEKDIINKESLLPFDLRSDLLIKGILIREAENRWVIFLKIHHIIFDGWSVDILFRDVIVLYNKRCGLPVAELPVLRIQYKDFSVWQNQRLNDEKYKNIRGYWLTQLGGDLPVLELRTDKPRPALQTYNGGRVSRMIEAPVVREFRRLCKEGNSTLFMGLLTLINTVLYRYTGQTDIIIGTLLAGREHADLEDQIGYFGNTLALRSRFDKRDTLKSLLKKVRQVTLDAYENQLYPFEELVNDLNIRRDLSRGVIFDVLVKLQNFSQPVDRDLEMKDIAVSHIEDRDHNFNKFDLSFDFFEFEEKLNLRIAYNSDLFLPGSMEYFAAYVTEMMNAFISEPGSTLDQLAIVPETEVRRLLTEVPEPEMDDTSVVDHFIVRAAKSPDRTAMAANGKILTYRQLDERSSRLAHYLISRYAAGPEDRIGICLDRSVEIGIAILAILKAGCAYVPVSLKDGNKRSAEIIGDAGLTLILTDMAGSGKARSLGEALDILVIDSPDTLRSVETQSPLNPDIQIDVSSLAYIIYTSGTTGTPKGVAIEHRSLSAYIRALKKNIPVDGSSVCLHSAPFTFSSSVRQFFLPLLSGARMVIVDINEVELGGFIADNAVTHIDVTPSLFAYVYRSIAVVPHLKTVLLASEVINPLVVKEFLSLAGHDVGVYGMYGQTELTGIALLTGRITANIDRVTYRPLSTTRAYILDAYMNPLPVGVAGELYIAGGSLARGYINSKELTDEKFVNVLNTRLYLSGDMARVLEDGSIEYLGRKDKQIKIRGFRIEPAEVEAALLRYSAGIKQVAVDVVEKDDEKHLVAYILSTTGIDETDIRLFLQNEVPEYMIPGFFLQLEKMPMTTNGKLDRNALPDLLSGKKLGSPDNTPRNETEGRLVAIWEGLLGDRTVGVTDNFFGSGGHSLLAIRLILEIRKAFAIELKVGDIFQHPTIEKLGRLVASGKTGTRLPAITKQSLEGSIPLSYSQERLWFIDKLHGSLNYHIPIVFKITGAPDLEKLDRGMRAVIERHEILRTTIIEKNGTACQVVETADRFALKLIVSVANLDEVIGDEISAPFNLSADLPIRATLLKITDFEFVVVIVVHHIAADGWSRMILIRALVEAYSSVDVTINRQELSVQYSDYAVWQKRHITESYLEKGLEYWSQKLQDLGALDLPADFVRPVIQSHRGHMTRMELDAKLTSRINEFLLDRNTSLFMFLLSAFKVLLFRYTGQTDICIGVPVANRGQKEIEELIGFFINTVVIRSVFKRDASFVEVLDTVRTSSIEAFEHQDIPFEKIVGRVVREIRTERNPLFDVMFSVNNYPELSPIRLDDIEVGYYGSEHITSQFDINFNVVEADERLILCVEYCTDLFKEDTIVNLLNQYREILNSILLDPMVGIMELSILPPHEKELILGTAPLPNGYLFNNHLTEAWKYKPLHVQFESTATVNWDAIAVIHNGGSWTYRQLDQYANYIGRELRASYGLRPGELVGLYLDRGAEYIGCLLGILKAGGVYVPLDTLHPVSRVTQIIEKNNIPYLISDKMYIKGAAGLSPMVKLLQIEKTRYVSEESPANVTAADDWAYVLFTSGSTGEPKGAITRHNGALNHIYAEARLLSLDKGCRFLQSANVGSDVSVWQMLGPLMLGGAVVVIDRLDYLDYHKTMELIVRHGVSLAEFVPGYAWVFLTAYRQSRDHSDAAPLSVPPDLDCLKGLMFTGEELPVSLVNKFKETLPALRLYNCYGPCEASDDVTQFEITGRLPENLSRVPIGKPIHNMNVIVLDELLRICPLGVPGEIYISGIGVGPGYLWDETRTMENFVPSPFPELSGDLLYKTGDVGRWLSDGNLEFFGRQDHQVKIRGNRIELKEIESVIIGHAPVKECYVACYKDGNTEDLVAYLVLNDGHQMASVETVRAVCKSRLPGYMVPSGFVVLDRLPRNLSDKIDINELRGISWRNVRAGQEEETAVHETLDETEMRLINIWMKELKREKVSKHDNFFEIGGHSLLATKVILKIREEFKINLPLMMLFKYSNVYEMAAYISLTTAAQSVSEAKDEMIEL
jgi:amino acid adenylation domain-containing protein